MTLNPSRINSITIQPAISPRKTIYHKSGIIVKKKVFIFIEDGFEVKEETEAEEIAELSKGRLRQKREDLREALMGEVREHHKFIIKASLKHIRAMEKILLGIEKKIREKIERDYKEEDELLQTIPGVKENASTVIAEIGVDMDIFPNEMHLSSWAGMSPGNNQSAGKKKPGSTTYGNKCLKAILTEFAWVASKTKDTYLRSKYHSLVGRRGKKKALVALGHKILIMCYHILKYKCAYKELGGDYLDKRRKDRITRSYIKRLNHLGYEVILQEAA